MTASDPEALQVAFLVLEALGRLGISYHVGGSYASAIHGVPRQTHDVRGWADRLDIRDLLDRLLAPTL